LEAYVAQVVASAETGCAPDVGIGIIQRVNFPKKSPEGTILTGAIADLERPHDRTGVIEGGTEGVAWDVSQDQVRLAGGRRASVPIGSGEVGESPANNAVATCDMGPADT